MRKLSVVLVVFAGMLIVPMLATSAGEFKLEPGFTLIC